MRPSPTPTHLTSLGTGPARATRPGPPVHRRGQGRTSPGVLFLAAALAWAAPGRSAGAPHLASVGWLEDPTRTLGPAQVAALPADRLRPLSGSDSAGFGGAPRWIRLELVNPGPAAATVALAFPFPLVEELDLFLADGPDGWQELRGGLARPAAGRQLQLEDGAHVHRLALGPGEHRLALLRVRTRGAGFLGVELLDGPGLARRGLVLLATALGLGAILVLLALNARLALSNRRRLDAEAWLFLFFQTGHLAIASGLVSTAWELPPGPLVALKAAMAAVCACAGVLFLRSFLGTRARSPRLDRLLAGLALVSLMGLPVLPLSIVGGNVVVAGTELVVLAGCVLATAEALLDGHRSVRLFVPGLLLFCSSTTWYLLSLLGAVPPSPVVILVETAGAALIGVSINVAVAHQDWSAAGAREDRLERLVAERTATLSEAVEALRAEAAERLQAEERFRLAFQTLPDAVSISRLEDGVFLTVNPGFLRMHGKREEEVVGRTAAELGLWAAADRTAYHRRLRQEGSVRDLEVRLGPGTPGERVLLLSSVLLHLGGVEHVLAIARDVTGIRVAEAVRARLEADLRQAQKLEAIGRLAAGVAHDFNNLLTAIDANVGLALDGLPAGHADRVYLQEALDTVGRAAGLTGQLLAFTRRQATAPRPVAVDEVVRGMERLLGRLVGVDVQLSFQLAGGLPVVRADPGQLEQVILNLVVNARDAVGQGGQVRVETSLAELPPGAGGDAGPGVRIAVTDDGVGMDEATRQRIFEPFFTTKPVGRGTGLGLATVYGIVQQHGGFVSVRSSPGQGSTFEVFLPAREGGLGAAGAAPPARAATA